MNDPLNLPPDLVEFLQSGKELGRAPDSDEPPLIGLHALSVLKLGSVLIDSDESPLNEDDPNVGKVGYYEVPAVIAHQ